MAEAAAPLPPQAPAPPTHTASLVALASELAAVPKRTRLKPAVGAWLIGCPLSRGKPLVGDHGVGLVVATVRPRARARSPSSPALTVLTAPLSTPSAPCVRAQPTPLEPDNYLMSFLWRNPITGAPAEAWPRIKLGTSALNAQKFRILAPAQAPCAPYLPSDFELLEAGGSRLEAAGFALHCTKGI